MRRKMLCLIYLWVIFIVLKGSEFNRRKKLFLDLTRSDEFAEIEINRLCKFEIVSKRFVVLWGIRISPKAFP